MSHTTDFEEFFDRMLRVAHKDQRYVAQYGKNPSYCRDSKARLMWRITPNNFGPNPVTDKVLGLGGWVLRPKDLQVRAFGLAYKLPESCP